MGVPIADLTAGLWAAISISAALRHREVTGEGQHIDISLLDTQISTLSIQGLNYLTSGKIPSLLGNAHPNIVPYQVFPTANGNIIVSVGNDNQFIRFCEFIGRPELASDSRFKSNDMRVRNREELTVILDNIMKKQTSEYWLAGLDKFKIANGPINIIEQAFNNPQIKERQMAIEMGHDAADHKPVKMIGSPIKMSKTPVSYRYPPPMLGEHTEDILEELLGLDKSTITKLRNDNII